MKENWLQHCISVMRAKVLKINELNINKHKFKPKVKCFKSRTTLILERCGLYFQVEPSY